MSQATIILGPKRAAETVCHKEQLQIWAHDVLVAIGMADYLREDMSGADLGDCERIIADEIKDIIEMAFDHPEARTIKRLG
jgi:hypothetical protein